MTRTRSTHTEARPAVAVVGLGCVFPGAADPGTFWRNVVNKTATAAEVPADRWIAPPDAMCRPGFAPDKAYSRKACLVRDFAPDLEGLDVDPGLVRELDPLYGMALHAGNQAFSAANVSSLDRTRAGAVLAAIALPTDASSALAREILGQSFARRLFKDAPPKAEDAPSASRYRRMAARVTSFPGALLARALRFGAGSYTLDAACASSLYAVKLACGELLAGRADLMLAGGVSRPDCLYTQVGFSQLRALSPSGRCAPFDAGADGLVVGEGAGMMALKRLDDALACGDEIFAVIRGIGLSNDLQGNLVAPASEGQVRAMKQAYAAAGWEPRDVDLIECHGAGTAVGDAVELRSLQTLWDGGGRRGQCAIGSVKSMIGHLLTGAGAVGMVKTLLGMKHRVFPPSLNFEKAAADSPLNDGPFRVQTDPEPWPEPDDALPRKAAVSAFGFGGINAHILLEEWAPAASHAVTPSVAPAADAEKTASIPVAVVGMGACFGTVRNLREFQEAVFRGESLIGPRPSQRWKGADNPATEHLDGRAGQGGYMTDIAVRPGEFRIPPREIPDVLPQQLLMLKAAAEAMKDAGQGERRERPDAGAVIGIDFDLEATDFHVRWNLHNLMREWKDHFNLGSDDADAWLAQLKAACGPALTPERTLGALGGIVASRAAREFRLGGPTFTVSEDAASGLKALEIGVRLLQRGELETVLAGAVDLAGDVRNAVIQDRLGPFSKSGAVRPFDDRADGTLPGDGAGAVVLKRLEDALRDGDRIYAVVKGLGTASNDRTEVCAPSRDAVLMSLKRAFAEAGTSPETVGLIEAHGGGRPDEDAAEAAALHAFFAGRPEPCALGSVKSVTGSPGAASAMAGLIKTCLCLYHEIIPPLVNFTRAGVDLWNQGLFHLPRFPQYWLRDRKNGPRRACVSAMTLDGGSAHAVLEAYEYEAAENAPRITVRERRRPLGLKPWGLFLVEGDAPDELLAGLDVLSRHLSESEGRHEPLEATARSWLSKTGRQTDAARCIALVGGDRDQLWKRLQEAGAAVNAGARRRIAGSGGLAFNPDPLGAVGEIAFVFPGSGNHYVGMGRDAGVQWPEILRATDASTLELKSQMTPGCYMPWRRSWEDGWEEDALKQIESDPLNMIFGQVTHGCMTADLAQHFGVNPAAAIGYSLGETAGYFATGLWADRGEMLARMRNTDLFTTQLAGPCLSLRRAWGLPEDAAADWRVAVVNRPARIVRETIARYSMTRLLIVNTPDACVIGGLQDEVAAAVRDMGCEAFYLEGVVTVHCDAVNPVAEAYRGLHRFPVTPPENIRYYSCAFGRAYAPDSKTAADSILRQAIHGFDFPKVVEKAYEDGVRLFLEMGPQVSSSRMIAGILGERPHLAISASVRGEDDYLTMLRFLGALAAERVHVDMEKLYGVEAYAPASLTAVAETDSRAVTRIIGGAPAAPPPLPEERKTPPPEPQPEAPETPEMSAAGDAPVFPTETAIDYFEENSFSALLGPMQKNIAATAEAHQAFLQFSEDLTRAYGDAFALQNRLLAAGGSDALCFPSNEEPAASETAVSHDAARPAEEPAQEVAFDRDMCMEFAVGAVARVLGPAFAEVDTYKVRVRLPDEPLMLVDRILDVEGEKGSMGSGRVVTEHAVLAGAWYLDGGRVPVCISVEAGQADLFLCSYLGIDLKVKGKRAYRLLDAKITFHRELPRPGDVIRYDIHIDKFVRQGETYMFFFRFEGYIGDAHLITMRDGCAGFFTEEEVRNSGGIILTPEEKRPAAGKSDFTELVPMALESYDDAGIEALRRGDLEGCFGSLFSGVRTSESIRLPGGRMKLIHRVPHLDPGGGRYGLGIIRAEADIQPDDWFLTCHFVDDMVMPGTLMYECCAHALRALLQRMGWVTERSDVCYEPVIGSEAVLRCRGPVTPDTKQVIYQVEIREIGYGPEPYVLADADMFADGDHIVKFYGMSMKMTGATRQEMESFWENRKQVLYDKRQILAFAVGNPSECFGEPYTPFDRDRRIARLPGPPYAFLDRVTRTEPDPWALAPGGWVEGEYDMPADAWYFKADRSGRMPFCVLLEIGLQLCGWLAAYAGSALRSENDLKFRNLGGKAVLHRQIIPESKTLVIRSRMTKVSEAADMIIEHFDFEVSDAAGIIHDGTTYFGFFTKEALAQQVGIRGAQATAYAPSAEAMAAAVSCPLADIPPITPEDEREEPFQGLAMPGRALRMIDEITAWLPDGGPENLGFVRGVKIVDPAEWFFKAHFYQDPVCPGSLGIESFIQLMKFMAMEKWPELVENHRFEMIEETPHEWGYRGQVIPSNKRVEVDAWITEVQDGSEPVFFADGFLKVDGLFIYEMKHFGLKLRR